MSIIQYDDGSTLDTDAAGLPGASTNSPPGFLLTDYAANFAPSNLTPGAGNVLDVLKYGFGRIVDLQVANIQSQNARPQYSQPATAPTPQGTGRVAGISSGTLLIAGAALVLVLVLAGDKGKG